MILTFTNATTRSASDLLADLSACRQLRHVSAEQKRTIVEFFFGEVEHSLLENRRLPGTGNFFVRVQMAFEEAVSIHGYSCDICDEIIDVPEDRWRYVAERLLLNLDGETRLCLCSICSKRFDTFCSREFQREARALWSRELEQMMLAFIAKELGREARRVIAGTPRRKRKSERLTAGENRPDRALDTGRSDGPGSIPLGGSAQKYCSEIQERVCG